MDFIKTLDLLMDWKQLPAYRAEPRVDFIVAGALPEIIKKRYNDEIKTIIPELPIRIGSIYSDKSEINKSYKVDFYVLLKSGKHIFIEFKTDSSSRRDKQDQYLDASKKAGMKIIIDGIIKIFNATSYKKKYQFLIDKLISQSLISSKNNILSETVKNNEIEILYIQPNPKAKNEIGFEEVSDLMQKSNDKTYKHFAKIIKSWSNN